MLKTALLLLDDVKAEAMETDVLAGSGETKDGNDIGNDIGDGTLPSHRPPTDHEVVAEGEADANGNTVSQPSEIVEQPLSEQDKVKVEDEGTMKGESSESAAVVEGVPPEEGAEAREEVVKELGEEIVEQSQEQQEVCCVCVCVCVYCSLIPMLHPPPTFSNYTQ